MKKEITKSPKTKAIQKEEDRWIDVHDDNVMREMGFARPFLQTSRDKNVWSKTPYERRILRNVKYSYDRSDSHFHSCPAKRGTVRTKLIVQLKSNKVFPKSTYSFICMDTDIEHILSKFRIVVDQQTEQTESVVKKYSFNGRTYQPDERPYIR